MRTGASALGNPKLRADPVVSFRVLATLFLLKRTADRFPLSPGSSTAGGGVALDLCPLPPVISS